MVTQCHLNSRHCTTFSLDTHLKFHSFDTHRKTAFSPIHGPSTSNRCCVCWLSETCQNKSLEICESNYWKGQYDDINDSPLKVLVLPLTIKDTGSDCYSKYLAALWKESLRTSCICPYNIQWWSAYGLTGVDSWSNLTQCWTNFKKCCPHLWLKNDGIVGSGLKKLPFKANVCQMYTVKYTVP